MPMRKVSEKARVGVISAAIPTVGAIVVALIGVLPAMRDRTAAIEQLSKENTQLKEQVNGLTTHVQELTPPYALRGSVRSTADNRPITDAELYIANPDNQATLDDSGSFVMRNTFRRAYWLVVARPNGKILRLLLNPSDPVGEAAGIAIRYTFDKE